VYTPHRSIVYHDYNHGPDTSVTSSWSRKAQELQVRCYGKGRRGGGKEGGVGCRASNGSPQDPSLADSYSRPSAVSSPLPQRSRNRLKVMLGYEDAPIARNSTEAHDFMGRWDLGTRRSLAQLIDFTGVDTINHEVRRVGGRA